MSNSLWVDMAVKSRFSWTSEEVQIDFDGYAVYLSPETERLSPRVSVLGNRELSLDEGATFLNRFLSRWSWYADAGVRGLFVIGSNMPNRPGLLGKQVGIRSSWIPQSPSHQIFMINTVNQEQDLALALYREGMSANYPLYSLFSFFRILNIKLKTGKNHIDWLELAIESIQNSDRYFKDEIASLEITGSLASHLWKERRCGIAHAFEPPVINPDDALIVRKLERESSLMKRLVKHFMVTELDICCEEQARKEARVDNYFLLSALNKNSYISASAYQLEKHQLREHTS
jgi:hypothetical protein